MDVRSSVEQRAELFFNSEKQILEELKKLVNEIQIEAKNKDITFPNRNSFLAFNANLTLLKNLIDIYDEIAGMEEEDGELKKTWSIRLIQLIWNIEELVSVSAQKKGQQSKGNAISLMSSFIEKFKIKNDAENVLSKEVDGFPEEYFDILKQSYSDSPPSLPLGSSAEHSRSSSSTSTVTTRLRRGSASPRSLRRKSTSTLLQSVPPVKKQYLPPERFIRQWIDFPAQYPLKPLTNIKVSTKSSVAEIIKNQFYFCSMPSSKMLDEIWRKHNPVGSKKLVKLAVISIADFYEFDHHNNSIVFNVFKFKYLELRHWKHILLPYSDHTHNEVMPEHLLWLVHQIQLALEQGDVVVMHGGLGGLSMAEKKERSAAVVLLLHQILYNRTGVIQMPLPDFNQFSSKNSGQADDAMNAHNSSSILRISTSAENYSDDSSEILIKKGIVLLNQIFKEGKTKFTLDLNQQSLSKRDWEKLADLEQKNMKMFLDCRGLVYVAQAIELYQKHNQEIEQTYQLCLMSPMHHWLQTTAFKNLMVYLSYKINLKVISVETIKQFFIQFVMNFDQAATYFCNIHREFVDCISNENAVNDFIAKYKNHAIGGLCCEIYNDQLLAVAERVDFLEALWNNLDDYRNSKEKKFDTSLYALAFKNKNQLCELWNKYFNDEKKQKLLSEIEKSKAFSSTEQSDIKFYFDAMSQEELIVNLCLAMNMYVKNIFLAPLELNDFTKRQQQHVLQWQRYPFGVILAKQNSDVFREIKQLYFILVCVKYSSSPHKINEFILDRNTSLAKLFFLSVQRVSNDARKRELIAKFVDCYIDALDYIAKRAGSNYSQHEVIYLDLFTSICTLEKEARFGTSGQYFMPILQYLYEKMVDIVIGLNPRFTLVTGSPSSSSLSLSSASTTTTTTTLTTPPSSTATTPRQSSAPTTPRQSSAPTTPRQSVPPSPREVNEKIHLLDIEVEEKKNNKRASLNFVPKATNDFLLKQVNIVAMLRSILSLCTSYEEQKECLKEFVHLSMVQENVSSPRSNNSVFFSVQSIRQEILSQEANLDHILSCANVEKLKQALFLSLPLAYHQ